MREVHPFGMYVPSNARYLLLGSFPGRQAFKTSDAYEASYDWFYRSRRGQFWSILEAVYNRPLATPAEQQRLMDELKIALGDVIESCERKKDTNADTDLINITYNTEAVASVLRIHPINTIYFTSSFVAASFRTHFKRIQDAHPHLAYITLPSPSPRYARMTKAEKIRRYRSLLPPT